MAPISLASIWLNAMMVEVSPGRGKKRCKSRCNMCGIPYTSDMDQIPEESKEMESKIRFSIACVYQCSAEVTHFLLVFEKNNFFLLF